jgi:NADP-dependent 3-hydroxy acid dehydrogenase YdfG
MIVKSKTAIVTGASSGLGKAISIALMEKGCTVYGIARSQNHLEVLQEKWSGLFYPIVLDLVHEEEVQTWIKSTYTQDNAPDILINNAGAGYFARVDDLLSKKWHQMININLNAVFYLTSQIVPFMKAKNTSSHIINIGSILGKVSSAEKSAYSASKYAIQGFSEALYKELRADNIKVSCINPGSIDTHFFEESGIKANDRMLKPKDLAATILHVLETPDNVLIDELTVRPLNLK